MSTKKKTKKDVTETSQEATLEAPEASSNDAPTLDIKVDKGALELILEGLGKLPTERSGIMFVNLLQAYQQKFSVNQSE